MTSKYIFPLFMLSIVALASGCASVKQYDGEARQKAEVATITKDTMRLHFRAVNGRPQGIYGNEVQVLPGLTKLSIGYEIMGLHSTVNQLITFNAEAGKEYILDYWRDDMRWGAYLLDKATNQTITKGVPESR